MREVAAVVASCLAVAGGPVAGQAVAGTVVDVDYGRPVAGVQVVLLDSALVPFDSARTGAEGRFRVLAPGAGRYALLLDLEGYLSANASVRVREGETATPRIEMRLLSVAASRVMGEAIDRESALQLPLEELCGEPLRPWEAGVLVGVTRDRATLDPIGEVHVTLEPLGAGADGAGGEGADPAGPVSRFSTDTGTYWFCNVPAGRSRLVARTAGFRPDTSYATIRAGTITWSDAILRRR